MSHVFPRALHPASFPRFRNAAAHRTWIKILQSHCGNESDTHCALEEKSAVDVPRQLSHYQEVTNEQMTLMDPLGRSCSQQRRERERVGSCVVQNAIGGLLSFCLCQSSESLAKQRYEDEGSIYFFFGLRSFSRVENERARLHSLVPVCYIRHCRIHDYILFVGLPGTFSNYESQLQSE